MREMPLVVYIPLFLLLSVFLFFGGIDYTGLLYIYVIIETYIF